MKSKEEILASKLDDLLADSRIEPHLIGRYFAQMARTDVYDNFEELALSARHEKENRIEWLKQAIIGEPLETTLENKCVILVDLWYGYFDDEEFAPFLNKHATAITTARAYTEGMVTELTGAGAVSIEMAFADLLGYFGIEDTGFDSLADFFLPNYDSEEDG